MSTMYVNNIAPLEGNTINVASGNTLSAPGHVIQVVNTPFSTSTNTTSASYVDLGLAASITPISTTSTILVLVSINAIYKNGHNGSVGVNVVRGSTQITQMAINGMSYTADSGASQTACSINYLDSPATTSSTTYKIQFKNGAGSGGSVVINDSSATSTLTLMEIAG